MGCSKIEINQGSGLSAMPLAVASKLSIDILIELKLNGHGLSFPSGTGCQMRLKREHKDLGGSYSYALYGSVSKAIKAAMSRYKQLLIVHPISKISAPKGLVSFSEKLDRRNGRTDHCYQVFYKKECV